MVAQEDLFPELLQMFKLVDDLYLHERLIAAAYGACCIDAYPRRLRSYAIAIYEAVFKTPPPRSILLRDYARGIVELCNKRTALPAGVNLKKCRPPYRSPLPSFKVTEAQLKRVAKRAGDEAILWSCSTIGDFGSHEIMPRTNCFTGIRLKQLPPVTRREKLDQFEAEVVNAYPERAARYKILKDASHLPFIRSLVDAGEGKKSDAELTAWAHRVVAAERQFLALLSGKEAQRYKTDVAPSLGRTGKRGPKDPPRVDLPSAMRWVAKTAYEIGWRKELFPNNSSRRSDYSRDRPRIERIGKKYQWMALDDLLCRLADNFWIGSNYGTPAKRYDNPLDIGFERDIDPTILAPVAGSNVTLAANLGWISEPVIVIADAAENELSAGREKRGA